MFVISRPGSFGIGNLAAGIAFLCSPVVSCASDLPVSLKLGTLGIVADTTYHVSEKVDARIEFSQSIFWWSNLACSLTKRGDCIYPGPWGNSYKIKQQTLGPIVDWYPADWRLLEGHFRTSIGLLLNNNNTEVQALSTYDAPYDPTVPDTYRLNGNNYAVSQIGRPHGKFSYRRLAPYFGVGWGNKQNMKTQKWSFAADIGFLFQGKPNLTYTATGSVPGLQADLEAERIKILNKERAWWPVISAGICYNW